MTSLAKVFYGITSVSHLGTHTVTEILSLSLKANGQEITHAADADTWLDFVGTVGSSVDWSLETTDLAGAKACLVGDDGTLLATLHKRGAGSNLSVSLLNAVITSNEIKPGSQEKGVATISGKAYSASGTASPLTIT